MAASPLSCFRLEATRGPHAGSTHRYCSIYPSPRSPSVRMLSIGRKKCCWLRLPSDLEVSSVHAEFRFVEAADSDMRLALRDIKSTNGTKLNGKPLKAQQDYALSDGDLIAVGRTSLRFVQVVHGPPCGEEGADSAATATAILTTSASSSSVAQSAVAPAVIVLDEEEEREAHALPPSAPASTGTSDAVSTATGSADQPDTEPAHGELVLLKPVKNVVVVSVGMDKSRKERGDNVELSLAQKSGAAMEGGNRTGCVDEYAPEEATCTTCSMVLGQLDMLESQAHLNECLGGRVAITTANVAAPSAASSMIAAKDAKPKTRKRGNAGGGSTRAKKPRKPKAGENGDDFAAAAPKPKKPRKRKRADAEENIELALALTGTSKMDKEQQTDMQLAATKKKLEQLDEQIAKLAKRRVNLVKTLNRLERTKEKLRKSQILPPAKVLQLLDLKSALDAMFPSNRQAYPTERRVSKEQAEISSVVAKRYAPSRWREHGIDIDCDEDKQAEFAAVAAISMWARASQQLFGLQRDSLLYRNSVLQAFLGDDEDGDSGSIDMDNANSVVNDDDNADFEREVDYESELAPIPPDHLSEWTPSHPEVPDVVKRVFPNWQRDLAFLQDQAAKEIEMALEAMNGAQAQADVAAVSDGEPNEREGCHTEVSVEHRTEGSYVPSAGEEQRLACEYMAQEMMQLIAEKKQRVHVAEPGDGFQQQQSVIDLAGSRRVGNQQLEQQSIVDVSENEAEEELYGPAPEELPKAATGCGLTAPSTEVPTNMDELEAKLQQHE